MSDFFFFFFFNFCVFRVIFATKNKKKKKERKKENKWVKKCLTNGPYLAGPSINKTRGFFFGLMLKEKKFSIYL